MPITVTAHPSVDGAYTVLEATGGVAPYTWTAFPAGRDSYTVPALSSVPSGQTTYDGMAPFGVAVVYQVRDSTPQSEDSAPHTLPDLAGAVLSDALDPTRWVLLPLVDQLPNEWQPRSVWFDVLDRRDPFVATAPMRLRNGQLVLRTDDQAQRVALLALLADGAPLVLRTACADAVDDVVLLPVESVREDLVMAEDKGGPRLFTITYQAVTRELGPYLPDPSWTWTDVVADPRDPTWTAVVAGFATWSDLVSNIRKP